MAGVSTGQARFRLSATPRTVKPRGGLFFCWVPFSTVGRTLLERGKWSVGELLLLCEDAGQLQPVRRRCLRWYVLGTSTLRSRFLDPRRLWLTLGTLRALSLCNSLYLSRRWSACRAN